MIEGFCNRLINSYKDVCNAVKDITLAITGDSSVTSQYRLIPGDKSGNKNFVVNAVDFSTLNETVVFIGPHTVGVKLFSKGHTPVCNYAISRKDGVQLVQIKYPDGTGMEQRCVFDEYSKAYLFDRTDITLPAEELLDIDVYRNAIIKEGFNLGVIYAQNPETKQLRIGIRIPKQNRYLNPLLQNPDIMNAELNRISGIIAQNPIPFFNAHTNCLTLVSPNEIYTNVYEFKKSFIEMIQTIKKNQDENQTKIDPDSPIQSDR